MKNLRDIINGWPLGGRHARMERAAKSIPHESEKAVGDDGRKEGKKIMRVSGFSQHANSTKKKGAG